MKFYNIAEPDLKEVVVGIDLGTTNSLVAAKIEGVLRVVPMDTTSGLMPSVVYYNSDQIFVGREACGQKLAISSIKRLIGKGSDDIETSRYKLHSLSNSQNIFLDINGSPVSPVQVSAEILKALKRKAEDFFQAKITKAVVTVPAYFDDASRNETKRAARVAGLEVLRLINEPTAAALAYNLDRKSNGAFLVYDLGGGTFDISILEKQNEVLQVTATAGDTHLGGDDFDLALLDLLKAKYRLEVECDEVDRMIIREIRENLSFNLEVTKYFKHTQINVKRQEFDLAITPLIDRTIQLVEASMKDAGLTIADLDEIILVGGATRTPAIRERLTHFFNKEPLDGINPEEIVVMGAAIQASAIMDRSSKDALLLDVIPLSLNLELLGGMVERIIPRNSSIPITITRMFTNYSADQTGVKIHILQGEGEKASECRSLGYLELKNITKAQPGEARIEVTFGVDADGVLTVQAEDLNAQVRQELVLAPSYGLDEKTILELLKV